MELLDDVLLASGGLEQWRQLRRFTVHLSIGGTLCRRMCGSVSMKEMVVEGGVHEQALEMTGFTAPERRALYRPDRVALEGSGDQLVEERRATAAEFRESLKASAWDEVLLAFYCGSLIRTYLDLPFVLADSDVVISELALPSGGDERLRALQVRFPERLAAHTVESALYFDSQALLRRQEYTALHDDGMSIAQTYSGYQCYSGILIPTLCRLLPMSKDDAATIAKPSLVDIEIFDAAFE
jgi:hypothetical protein